MAYHFWYRRCVFVQVKFWCGSSNTCRHHQEVSSNGWKPSLIVGETPIILSVHCMNLHPCKSKKKCQRCPRLQVKHNLHKWPMTVTTAFQYFSLSEKWNLVPFHFTLTHPKWKIPCMWMLKTTTQFFASINYFAKVFM